MVEEIAESSARLEDSADYTEEDQLLVHSFEGEAYFVDNLWIQKTVAKLSADFPNLLFALDISPEEGWPQPERGNRTITRREYYLDGKMQTVHPYVVVPDFDMSIPMVDVVQ